MCAVFHVVFIFIRKAISIVTDTVFDVQNVAYRYNDVVALDGMTLHIKRGQRVVILGANGSGKSTLLRILDGLYFADSGAVSVFGEALTEARLQDEEFAFQLRRRVALVFQNPDVQLFSPTVFDEVAFGPLQLRWPKEEIRRRVNETLDEMEISHLKDRSPHRLSGGEKRVALASVLILDPEVLLLDEPTVALDPKSQSQVIDFLASWSGGAKNCRDDDARLGHCRRHLRLLLHFFSTGGSRQKELQARFFLMKRCYDARA
jgi:cobalt/nickel transport system ATP-binding protein